MTVETQIVLQTIMDFWMVFSGTLIVGCLIEAYRDIKGDK